MVDAWSDLFHYVLWQSYGGSLGTSYYETLMQALTIKDKWEGIGDLMAGAVQK